MKEKYDLVVIGAGPGGYSAAIRAAQEGLRVAVIERREVGGTCLNRGCIPTKTLLHAARLYDEIQNADELGIHADSVSFDINKMYSRKDDVVAQLRSGVEKLLKSNQVELFHGTAVITAQGEIALGDEKLFATNILIATGSVPSVPPITGIDSPAVVTSDEVLTNAVNYRELVIVGGGVIGVEFATIFQSLGCKVTIVESMGRILPTMDRGISQNLNMILKKRGVVIHTSSQVEEIQTTEHRAICIFQSKGKRQQVEAQAVLVATGRKANIEGLFGDDVAVEINRGIVVDSCFQTSIANVYAIGDVISGGIQLAHIASAQALNVVAHILGKAPEVNLKVIPSCIYTEPEIANVGISEAEAKDQGIPVKTGKYTMSGNGKSVIDRQERGFIKLIFHKETEVLLGAQLMCARATDLVSELTTAIGGEMKAKELASVIRPHPTFSEGVTEAVESVFGKAIHIVNR